MCGDFNMSELGFKEVRFSGIVTFVTENGKVAEFEDIEDEIKESLDSVFYNIMDSYNNVVKFRSFDGVEITDGSDTNKQ